LQWATGEKEREIETETETRLRLAKKVYPKLRNRIVHLLKRIFGFSRNHNFDLIFPCKR
jgi:hypothetical protein